MVLAKLFNKRFKKKVPLTYVKTGDSGEASIRTDAANLKFTLVVGGSVGNDPYNPETWSGSALHFVRALKQAEALNDAIGLALPPWQDVALKARNFSPSRRTWRLKFYLDSAYRKALTRSAAKKVGSSEQMSPFLQIGAMYSLPRATGYKVPCFSYHDGNAIEALRGGYEFVGVPARRIDEAIQYEREVAQEMTAVFTFSEYLRKSFIQDFELDEKRVFNVGGGVNIDDIPEATAEKNYEKRNILFVGVDFDRKGGNELLSAFRVVRETMTEARLNIVGPHQLPDGANQPGIVFHGNLSKAVPEQRNRLYRLYRDASVLVLPSKYEPFGVAPLEAMLFEVPCIVTDAWALREIVTPGINGALVQKGSIESLASTLIKSLKAPEELARMGRAARKMVLKNYVWANVVAKMRISASAQ